MTDAEFKEMSMLGLLDEYQLMLDEIADMEDKLAELNVVVAKQDAIIIGMDNELSSLYNSRYYL
jgi:hypothetical protein